MNSKIIIGSIVVSAVILVFGAYSVGQGSKTPSVVISSYNSTDQSKPKAEIPQSSADLGPMKVSDEKSNDFMIKNSGDKPLQLSNIKSSCGCTVARIVIDGKESEEFGMHSQGSEIFEIAPQKSAIVRITYRPFVMPVYGFVEREVYVQTNDPLNPNLTFKVTTNVK